MQNTPLAKKLLEILQTENEWLTRRQLAERLGRRSFTPYDLQVLTNLIENGLVEASTRPLGVVRTENIYHIKRGEQ